MLRRSLLVSAVLLAGSLGFVGSAKAATGTADVPFTVELPASCSFGTPTPGTLGLNALGNALDSKAAANSDVPAGTSGSVTVSCTGAGKVTVVSPVDNPVAPLTVNPTATTNVGFIKIGTQEIDSSNTTGIALTPVAPATTVTDIPVEVNMTATKNTTDAFATGKYGYTVRVIATPGV
jgi:uncharacterized membrane protein YtjA (UPF0391 family)